MAYPPPIWPGEFGADAGLGEGQLTENQEAFMMDGILQEGTSPSHWHSSQAPRPSVDSPSFNRKSDLSMPEIRGTNKVGPGFNTDSNYAVGSNSGIWSQNRFGGMGKWNSISRCIAGTTDDSGAPNICVCDVCWESCQQDTFTSNPVLSSLPHGTPRSTMGHQSSHTKITGRDFQHSLTEDDVLYPVDSMMLDEPNQTNSTLSSSRSSSGLPWMAQSSFGSNSQEDLRVSIEERRASNNGILLPQVQDDIRERNGPKHNNRGPPSEQAYSSRRGFSSPATSLEDGYKRLEINCVYLRYPNELQKQALSIISGLSMERVEAFYADKHRGVMYPDIETTQSQETQSLLGIRTVNKEDINFSDSAYYSHSSSGSSGAQNRHNVFELDSAPVSPEERPSKPMKGQRKVAPKHVVNNVEEIAKIFECTWRGCQERFRSKRDWRRHEESIHCQQFTWECPVNVSPSKRNYGKTTCGRKFKRDDKFREHLRNEKGGHGFDDLQIGTMVEDARRPLSPASLFRQECGFCGENLPTWEYRIDHIADEYTKKGKNMSMWKDPWPRGGSSGSKRNDDDDENDDEDDEDGSGDGGHSHWSGNQNGKPNAFSRSEPKNGQGGDSNQRSTRAHDRSGAGSRRSHNVAASGKTPPQNDAVCLGVKRELDSSSDTDFLRFPSVSSDDEGTWRAMARRRRSARADTAPKRCSDPICNKEFIRPCDLTKHEKTHSRPWKCAERTCKYHEYGWPSEKELDRHTNDKHLSAPALYKCHYSPCSYQSKRESNCRQHMEKSHGWTYVRSKRDGANSGKFGELLSLQEKLDSFDKRTVTGSTDKSEKSMAGMTMKYPLSARMTPRRSKTTLDDVVDSHKRRVALTLAHIDRGLSGLDIDDKYASNNNHDIAAGSLLTTPFHGSTHQLDDQETLQGLSSQHGIDITPSDDIGHRPSNLRRQRHLASDSGIGSSICSGESIDASVTSEQTPKTATYLGRPGFFKRFISRLTLDPKPGLSDRATNHIREFILEPLLANESLKDFHPIVSDIPQQIKAKQITSLRDLEKTLLFLAPEKSKTPDLYRDFCIASILGVKTTIEYLSKREQTRPIDRPYTNGYFIDLVEQVEYYSQQLRKSQQVNPDVQSLPEKDMNYHIEASYPTARSVSRKESSLGKTIIDDSLEHQHGNEKDAGGVATNLTPKSFSRMTPIGSSTSAGGSCAFGFSVGDLVSMIQVCHNIYQTFKDNSENSGKTFTQLVDDVRNVHHSLLQLEKWTSSPQFNSRSIQDDKFQPLDELLKDCQTTLTDLSKLVDNLDKFKLLQRLKFDKGWILQLEQFGFRLRSQAMKLNLAMMVWSVSLSKFSNQTFDHPWVSDETHLKIASALDLSRPRSPLVSEDLEVNAMMTFRGSRFSQMRAQADTGSSGNWISIDFAHKHGLSISAPNKTLLERFGTSFSEILHQDGFHEWNEIPGFVELMWGSENIVQWHKLYKWFKWVKNPTITPVFLGRHLWTSHQPKEYMHSRTRSPIRYDYTVHCYFEPITIEDRTFIDGGFETNNPSKELYYKVFNTNMEDESSIGLLSSIGTGHRESCGHYRCKYCGDLGADRSRRIPLEHFSCSTMIAPEPEQDRSLRSDHNRFRISHHLIEASALEDCEVSYDAYSPETGIPLARWTIGIPAFLLTHEVASGEPVPPLKEQISVLFLTQQYNPREYFLAVLEKRINRVSVEWNGVYKMPWRAPLLAQYCSNDALTTSTSRSSGPIVAMDFRGSRIDLFNRRSILEKVVQRYRRRRGEGPRTGLRRKKRRSATSSATGRPRPPCPRNQCERVSTTDDVAESERFEDSAADADDEGASSNFETEEDDDDL